jgi:hypothetical protein
MVRPGLFAAAALVLTAAALAAQTPASKPTQKPAPPASTTQTTKPPAPQARSSTPYVPAVMQQRMATLSGCLQRQKQDWVLSDVKVSQQGDVAQGTQGAGATAPATYKLEGLSAARLSVLVGKRVDVTGAFQGETKQAATAALPRFEATNVSETAGADAKPCS